MQQKKEEVVVNTISMEDNPITEVLLGTEEQCYSVWKQTVITKKGRRKEYHKIVRRCLLLKPDNTVCNRELIRCRDASNHLKSHEGHWIGIFIS